MVKPHDRERPLRNARIVVSDIRVPRASSAVESRSSLMRASTAARTAGQSQLTPVHAPAVPDALSFSR